MAGGVAILSSCASQAASFADPDWDAACLADGRS